MSKPTGAKPKTTKSNHCEINISAATEDPKLAKVYEHPPKYRPTQVRPISKEIQRKAVRQPLPSEPVVNSRNRIERKMKDVRSMQPKRYQNENDLTAENKTTVEEKITKKMNFPLDKRLYKQLISLNVSERSPPTHNTHITYEPSVRDREPRLEDYFTPTFGPEYAVPVEITFPPQSTVRNYNGMRIYQLMRSWDTPD